MRRMRWILGILMVLGIMASPLMTVLAQDASPVTEEDPVSPEPDPTQSSDPIETQPAVTELAATGAESSLPTVTVVSKAFVAAGTPLLRINGSTDPVVYVDPDGSMTISMENVYFVRTYTQSNCVGGSDGGWFGTLQTVTVTAANQMQYLADIGGGFVMSVQGVAEAEGGGLGEAITTCRTIVFGLAPPGTATATLVPTPTATIAVPSLLVNDSSDAVVYVDPNGEVNIAAQNVYQLQGYGQSNCVLPIMTYWYGSPEFPINETRSAASWISNLINSGYGGFVMSLRGYDHEHNPITDCITIVFGYPPPSTATATTVPTITAAPTSTATIQLTNTATMVPVRTATSEPTAIATTAPTNTLAPAKTATSGPTSTATAESTETATSVPTNVATATFEPTNTATIEPSDTATIASTPTATSEAIVTATARITHTPTAAPTNTMTVVPTMTATAEPTSMATATRTPFNTPTSTVTTTTPTNTMTLEPTATGTTVPTNTATSTAIPTLTPTATPTKSPVPTNTATSSPTVPATSVPAQTETAIPTPTDVLPTRTATVAAVTVQIQVVTSDGRDVPAGTTWVLSRANAIGSPSGAGRVYAAQIADAQGGRLETASPSGSLLPIANPIGFGTYRLTIDAPGYQPFEETIDVGAAATSFTVVVRLIAIPTTATVPLAPAQAPLVGDLPNTGTGTQSKESDMFVMMVAALLATAGLLASFRSRRR